MLDGPRIVDNYYLNLLDWGKKNILAVALGGAAYLWDMGTRQTEQLLVRDHEDDHPTSVAWSKDGNTLATGFANSSIELWDAMALHRVR